MDRKKDKQQNRKRKLPNEEDSNENNVELRFSAGKLLLGIKLIIKAKST